MKKIWIRISKYEQYPNKKWKILIAFEDKIAYIFSNKKQPIVTELFFRGSKLNNFLYVLFCCTKYIGLNFTHNESPQSWKKLTGKQYCLLVNDITLASDNLLRFRRSDNLLRFRRNLLKRILKLIMAIDDRIRDENMQFDINREVEKMSSSK